MSSSLSIRSGRWPLRLRTAHGKARRRLDDARWRGTAKQPATELREFVAHWEHLDASQADEFAAKADEWRRRGRDDVAGVLDRPHGLDVFVPARNGANHRRADAERRTRAAELRALGWTQKKIAAELGVHVRTVRRDLQRSGCP